MGALRFPPQLSQRQRPGPAPLLAMQAVCHSSIATLDSCECMSCWDEYMGSIKVPAGCSGAEEGYPDPQLLNQACWEQYSTPQNLATYPNGILSGCFNSAWLCYNFERAAQRLGSSWGPPASCTTHS